METPDVTVVIETPKGSRLKLKFDRGTGLYKVDRFLAKALSFLFNFGFIPRDRGCRW
jgi:inorganic pyrophosphatase